MADELVALNQAGVRLARCAAGSDGYVAGAMGPLGVGGDPQDSAVQREAEASFREQAVALTEGAVDLFVLETFRSVDEASAAIRAVRSVSTLPVVAQMTMVESGTTPDGVSPEGFAARLVAEGASVVGVNCGAGPVAMLETVQQLHGATAVPLAAQPNAGLPRQVEGRTMYMSSPDYLASYARRFIRSAVRLVGGCCGTTPDHIREIAAITTQPA